ACPGPRGFGGAVAYPWQAPLLGSPRHQAHGTMPGHLETGWRPGDGGAEVTCSWVRDRVVTGRSHRPRSTWPDQARLAFLAVTHRYKRHMSLARTISDRRLIRRRDCSDLSLDRPAW